ncbi:hypothetical protein CJF31_00010555 [Rutstroemia sp. NJR-2017a BVV2]|nr:hypothetical protein CJF31_00010555 [Rutstroemia sp. NJR-2017a BVV2]
MQSDSCIREFCYLGFLLRC